MHLPPKCGTVHFIMNDMRDNQGAQSQLCSGRHASQAARQLGEVVLAFDQAFCLPRQRVPLGVHHLHRTGRCKSCSSRLPIAKALHMLCSRQVECRLGETPPSSALHKSVARLGACAVLQHIMIKGC